MKELNELIDRYDVSCHCSAVYVRPKQDGHLVMYSDYASLAQRAEAVEAALAEEKRINSKLREDRAGLARECNAFEEKLAELQKQDPVGYVSHSSLRMAAEGHMGYISNHQVADFEGGYVYARPAPAINLAELVPDYALRELDGVIDWIKGLPIPTNSATKWLIKMSDLRDTILRKIEEQSQ